MSVTWELSERFPVTPPLVPPLTDKFTGARWEEPTVPEVTFPTLPGETLQLGQAYTLDVRRLAAREPDRGRGT